MFCFFIALLVISSASLPSCCHTTPDSIPEEEIDCWKHEMLSVVMRVSMGSNVNTTTNNANLSEFYHGFEFETVLLARAWASSVQDRKDEDEVHASAVVGDQHYSVMSGRIMIVRKMMQQYQEKEPTVGAHHVIHL